MDAYICMFMTVPVLVGGFCSSSLGALIAKFPTSKLGSKQLDTECWYPSPDYTEQERAGMPTHDTLVETKVPFLVES